MSAVGLQAVASEVRAAAWRPLRGPWATGRLQPDTQPLTNGSR